MCYDDNARPPIPPGANGKAQGEDIVLEATDGNKFMAYSAKPEQQATAQVLIYPDVRGLHQFYKDLALRFAEVGIAALAIDYFGRSAGLTGRDESFEYMPHVMQMKPQTFFADVTAALAHLNEGDGASRATFTTGFCLGGTLSLITGTQSFNLAGIIAFYAGMSRNFGGEGTLLDRAVDSKYPVLGLFGEADQGIPVSQVHELDQKLDEAGIEHKLVIYPGAPHSFFDRKATEFAEASADSWKQVLNFIQGHVPSLK